MAWAKTNMDSLNKQKLLCQKEIQETRQDINKKLDELEQDILGNVICWTDSGNLL
jgi:hypothetical protein